MQENGKAAYIEAMGSLMKSYGLPRISGRVLAALLLAEPPEQSAEQLAESLKASRGALSGALQLLEKMGYLERINRAGVRKEYFRYRSAIWPELFLQQFQAIRRFREMAEQGLELMQDAPESSQQGLNAMLSFYRFWEQEQPLILERWQAQQRGGEGV
ncbi:MAG: GbsR/MarR family transcriptional regulator [Candidatus Sericytochromatia bacterium]